MTTAGFPLIPQTCGRSCSRNLLEIDDNMVKNARARLFGSWEMNWTAYNFAHDVALPGSGSPVGFLMYLQAETTEGRLDRLDPDNFKV